MTWLKKCEREGVDVHIIAGNHDIIRTGSYTVSALDIVSSVEMLSAKVYKDVDTIDFDGVSVTLVPYRDTRMYEVQTTVEALDLLKKEFMPQLDTIPQDNKRVLVGHLALEGSIRIGDEIDDELNEIFCPAETFKDWQYTWMGHVHNPQIMHDATDKEPYYVAHIGSMERSDFSKHEMLGRKFIVLFDSDKSGPAAYEEIDLPNRSIHKVEVTVPKGKDSTEYVINNLSFFHEEKSLSDAIVKLEVKLASDVPNVDRQQVTEHLYKEIGSHYICYFSESRIIDTVVVDTDSIIDNSMTPEASINTFWNNVYDLDDTEREECRALALEINKEFEEKILR
jgi:DNA repair exonuclease SbcCD nuclease subunit